jgi:mono/diheme cytochrome c family protein
VTGVTWLDGELWHGTWESEQSETRRVDPHTGEVLEQLDMPQVLYRRVSITASLRSALMFKFTELCSGKLQNRGTHRGQVMRTSSLAFALSFGVIAVATTESQSQDAPPAWAYPVNPPNFQRAPDDGSTRKVPDSTAGYTLTQVRDLFAAPDWHPEDHPPMPAIVASGRKPDVFACGVCHRADGSGGAENASLFGQPAEYILQQTVEFKNGRRNNAPHSH